MVTRNTLKRPKHDSSTGWVGDRGVHAGHNVNVGAHEPFILQINIKTFVAEVSTGQVLECREERPDAQAGAAAELASFSTRWRVRAKFSNSKMRE